MRHEHRERYPVVELVGACIMILFAVAVAVLA